MTPADLARGRELRAVVIKIAADLARGSYLPNLPEDKRVGPRKLYRALEDAHERHKVAAIKLRGAWDASNADAEREAKLRAALAELVACLGERQMDIPTPILLAARRALAGEP